MQRFLRVGPARTIALLGIGLLVAGCGSITEVIGGTAHLAADSMHRPLTGQAVRQVLLGDQSLSRILNEPFMIDERLPPRFGGPEALQDEGPAPDADCLGVAEMLHQRVYGTSKVGDVAMENWRHATVSTWVTDVKEGVASLPTAADAAALFARFAGQWQRCDGRTVRLPDEVLRLDAKISDVRVAPAMLAGTVSIGLASQRVDNASVTTGRALGVRDNCLVEVEVDFFNSRPESLRGSPDVDDIPTGIARAMLDRVGQLS